MRIIIIHQITSKIVEFVIFVILSDFSTWKYYRDMIQCLRIPVADPIKLFFFANKEFLLFAATLGIYYQLLPPFQKKVGSCYIMLKMIYFLDFLFSGKRQNQFLNQFLPFLKLKIWTNKVLNGQKSCFRLQGKLSASYFCILSPNVN